MAETSTPESDDAAALFASAAAEHKRELNDLFVMRGASLVEMRDVSANSVAQTLATRGEEFSFEAGYLDNTAVLFYSYEEDSLQIWLLDQDGIQAHAKRNLSTDQIAASINNLRDSLRVDSLQSARLPHRSGASIVKPKRQRLPLDQSLSEITNILIPPPIADKLTGVKHLLVVPVLGLSTVPFAILQPFNSGSFLLDKMSITMAPSLFDIGQNIVTWEPKFDSPLIIGNPYLQPNEDWFVPSLPGAEAEAKSISRAINAKPLIGKAATKQNVLTKSSDSDLLYFATHGIANSDDPLSGGFLMLSAEEFSKGWWTAKEIQAVRLNHAKIAVLSACQTGLGKVHDAGVIGLARAFQIAGVPRVVMSLWSVNDAATSDLMQAFVRNMQDNVPSEALRLSMLEVRAEQPDPSLWASFVLFGTPR